MSLLELFCAVDDFLLSFEPQWKASRLTAGKQRERAVVHLIAGLIAYSHQDKKPGLHLDEHALLAA